MTAANIYSFPTRKPLTEEYATKLLRHFHEALKENNIKSEGTSNEKKK